MEWDETHRTSLRIWVNFGRNMAIDDCHVDGRGWNVSLSQKLQVLAINAGRC
jgi:hypothetical protein